MSPEELSPTEDQIERSRETLPHRPTTTWLESNSGIDYAWTIAELREIVESSDLTIDATGHAGLAELVA